VVKVPPRCAVSGHISGVYGSLILAALMGKRAYEGGGDFEEDVNEV